LNRNRALDFCFDAFSSREPVSTLLENTIDRRQIPALQPADDKLSADRIEDIMDRRHILKAVTLAGSALAAPALADEINAAAPLIEKFAATLTAHDITAFAALFSDNYVNHQLSAAASPPPQGKSSKQVTVGFFAARLAGMPDLKVEVEATVASADRAAASFVYTGTHNGTFMGIAPIGRALRFTSCDIFRVESGLIAEHWGMGDIAGILAQLRG
jgi:steroid delta-isomerase-like uncharacterized protein